MEIITTDQAATRAFGKELAKKLKGGDILCLLGELGSGKTTLVKGIAEGLNISGDIVSPTFTLLQLYPLPQPHNGARQLAHIDTYRLENSAELIAIGAEDYLGAADTIAIIEWPEKITELLKNKKVVSITFDHLKENQRSIKMLEEGSI